MRVMVCAGGTGGHVYPAIALAKYCEHNEQAEVLFVGTNKKMEATEVPKANLAFFGLDAKGFGGSIHNRIECLLLVKKNIAIAKKKMKEFRPDIVVGFGGYVTVPVMIAAKQLKIPTLIHEQNSVAGLANKTLAKFMDGVAVSFAHSLADFPKHKTKLLGSPRASAMAEQRKDQSILHELRLNPKDRILYIVMGSLGSESVNAHMVDVIKQLAKTQGIQVVYVTGKEHYEHVVSAVGYLPSHIHMVPYVDQMRLLPFVDVICCRAGATTLAEITTLGIPALVIPSPYVAHNHQVLNAAQLKEQKAAFVVEEKDLTCQGIVDKLLTLSQDDALRNAMRKKSMELSHPNASRDIVVWMKELIKR